MPKQKPIFLDSDGNLKVTDSTTNTLDESLIQNASSSQNGLMTASDYQYLYGLSGGGDYTFPSITAAVNISALKVVCVDTSSDQLNYATVTNSINRYNVLGIALSTKTSGSTVKVATGGKVTGFTSLSPGDDYFLSTNGALSSSPPTNSGEWVQKIGTAVNASTLVVDLKPRILLS